MSLHPQVSLRFCILSTASAFCTWWALTILCTSTFKSRPPSPHIMDSTRFYLEDKLEFQRAPYYHLPSFKKKSNKKLVKLTNTKSHHLSSESEELSRCSFSALSVKYSKKDEIILKILENLDWRSLCRVSRVNKRLYRVARDPYLYTYLNIDYSTDWRYDCIYSHFNERRLLRYFTPRCKHLRLLSLKEFHIKWSDLQKFLISCGRHLTHLRLLRCSCINDFTLPQIVEICKDLKELDLDQSISEKYVNHTLMYEGLSCLENLQFLECLCLAKININFETACKILRRNRRIRHLAILGINSLSIDDLAAELRNSCPDLESISLFYQPISSEGIEALADCQNLRKVDLQGCTYIHQNDDSFRKLFSSCQRLEKINLCTSIGISEYNMEALTLCKNLKYLNIEQTTFLTPAICLKILLNCPKLKKITVKYPARRLYDPRPAWEEKKGKMLAYTLIRKRVRSEFISYSPKPVRYFVNGRWRLR